MDRCGHSVYIATYVTGRWIFLSKVGRPKRQPVEELERGVAEYFLACETAGRFPTESGMLLHLDLDEAQYRAKWKDKQYGRVLERARLRRMDWLENQMVVESRVSSGCMNALKQEKNGGYADKAPVESRARSLVIRMEGVGKSAAE